MPIHHIEHMLVVANDIEATKDWYVEVLGLEVGDHPDFGVPVYWLYAGAQDVVHVVQASQPEEVSPTDETVIAAGGRPVHHVAFRAEGLSETLAHLRSLEVPFIEQQAGSQSLYQVFVRDPNGVIVELNFSPEEAGGETVAHVALRLGTD